MNVQLDGIGHGNVIDNSKTITYGTAKAYGTDAQSGYTLDISGAVTDNSAYAGHGRTTEDIVCDAAATELALQSQYLTVMSNCVSGEDFAELSKDGYQPCNTDVETAVTVVDEIKATLAEAGVVISGYNDDLAPEVLESITGSEARAQQIVQSFRENDIPVTEENVREVMDAIEKAGELSEPNDGTVKFLVEQGMEPTVENLYLAQHSGSVGGEKQSYGYYDQNGSGYYAKRAEDYDWEALRGQMEKVLKEAGLQIDQQSMEQAKFLIEEGVPLTADNMRILAGVREIAYPLSEEQVIRAAAAAISDGRTAQQANLAETDSAWKQAVYWKEQADRVSDEAVRAVSESGEELNLRNLSAAQKQIDENAQAAREDTAQTDSAKVQKADSVSVPAQSSAVQSGDAAGELEWIAARRQLEELRLQMTITASRSLIKKGYAIDTTELSQLVEDLKAAEEKARQTLFRGTDAQEDEAREDLFTRTLQARERLYAAPAALVGRFVQESRTFGEIAEQGGRLRELCEQAGERYETMMTKPRSDLGDSIRKAFANVDEILTDMGLETSDENRRAVRILGYNRMEITPEQIETIKDADLSLRRVIEKLTPSSVLGMIREGKNPLEMTVPELEKTLDEAEKDPAQSQEKYSEYLCRLERADEITPEEKESYIGIYRLFRQIEKSDGAVIGSLVNQGAELTMKNLLSAVRTGKNKGLNVTVDDNYGALREIAREDITIDRQIMSAYEAHVCSAIYDRLEPEALHEIDLNENPTMEKLLARLQETAEEPQIKEKLENAKHQYRSEMQEDIRQAADISEENIEHLLEGRQPVTVSHILALQAMRTHRNQGMRTLYELAEREADRADERAGEGGADGNEPVKELSGERFLEAADRLKEEFTDAQSAGSAYASFTEAGMALLERRSLAAGTEYLDIKAYQLIGRQLSLAAGMAREEQYRIPVLIDGQVTALDVRIRHGSEEKGHVSVTMEHEVFGKAGVDMEVTSVSSISGYFAYSDGKAADVLGELKGHLAERLGQEQLTLQEFHSICSERLDLDRFGSEPARTEGQRAQRETDAPVKKEKDAAVRTSALYQAAKAFVMALQDTVHDQKGAIIG